MLHSRWLSLLEREGISQGVAERVGDHDPPREGQPARDLATGSSRPQRTSRRHAPGDRDASTAGVAAPPDDLGPGQGIAETPTRLAVERTPAAFYTSFCAKGTDLPVPQSESTGSLSFEREAREAFPLQHAARTG